ncbi:MAG TPA: adenylate/guanylate cyclase domain-containing protein, partial [Aquabacterium sp.]|uniref:adenylate/guanylate cyclase domain-containing protein n=1 Tax=Aquabacterium sp. TaxID=1872578 RepID=UPI002E35CD62
MSPEPASMNPDVLTAWLQTCGLQHLARVLIDNGIDDDVLSCLTEPDLEKIGLSLGDRKRLLRAIGAREPHGALHRSHPEAGELRQLTIMFCDLVDATALSERLTPEQWRAVVLAYQQAAVAIIEHHGGSVAQYLGDGLLVYVGYPQALEDAAERALRAGLALVSAVARLQWPDPALSDLRLAVRIGVHTGTVVMGEIGAGRRREQLALGDAPNLAARLQAMAAPGTVVLSETTRTLAGGGFTYEDLGRHVLKGIREPRQVWQVTGITAMGSRFDASLRVGLTPLIGRVHELALLMDRWDAARQGHGQVVMLGGEPGVGKSRMIKELRDRLGNAGLQAVALQCSPHGVHRAFHPFVDYIEQVLGWGPEVSAEARLQQMRTVLLENLQVDPVHFGPLAFLLSIPVPGEHAMPAGSASQHEQASIDALVAVMQALSQQAPLLGLIEDVHWADPATLALLKQLVAATRQQPLLLVITHRPEFHASLDRHAHVTQLKMPGLREVEVLSMIEHLAVDRPLSDAWLRHIVDKTDGIPLFVEELTRSILEAPSLPDRPNSTAGVPATLRDSLMARLERYPGSRELAEVGAAIGRDFSHALVSEVSDMSPVALEQAVAALIQSGLVLAQPSRQGTIYTFKHALVQDAAYDSMVQARRESLHREILRALESRTPGQPEPEPSLLARHARAAGQRHMAVMRWRQASERALKRLSLHEAEAHLQSALATLGELPASSQRDQTAMHLHALLGTVHMLGRGWA